MPTDYMQTLWVLWKNGVISEDTVNNALSLFGFSLVNIGEDGLRAEMENTTHSFKPY